MAFETNKTPDDLGPTTPKDLHLTSDIRLVMIEVAKLEERVSNLIEDNKDHKSDLRRLLAALIAGFLVLAGMFIYGYDRLDDRNIDVSKAVTLVGTRPC